MRQADSSRPGAAALAAAAAPAAWAQDAERCYGVALAGENDGIGAREDAGRQHGRLPGRRLGHGARRQLPDPAAAGAARRHAAPRRAASRSTATAASRSPAPRAAGSRRARRRRSLARRRRRAPPRDAGREGIELGGHADALAGEVVDEVARRPDQLVVEAFGHRSERGRSRRPRRRSGSPPAAPARPRLRPPGAAGADQPERRGVEQAELALQVLRREPRGDEREPELALPPEPAAERVEKARSKAAVPVSGQ